MNNDETHTGSIKDNKHKISIRLTNFW